MLTAHERAILRGKLEIYEGRVPHMYLDSRGFVTTGVGHLLRTAADARALGFVTEDGKVATPARIDDEYQAVARLLRDEAPAYYRRNTELTLPDAEIDRLTEQHIDSFHRELRVIYREFDDMPRPVRLALFDMIFNLGATGLRREWPRMNKAIREQNWRGAARESFRPDVQAARNTYVRQLLEKAAALEVVP